MRFQKPFTLRQRQDAASVYDSLALVLANMRFHYPPITNVQRELLRELKHILRDFRRTLREKDAKVDVRGLNALTARGEAISVDYWREANRLGWRYPDA